MAKITQQDLNSIALGSTVLGSGGGGDPAYDLLMAQHVFETYGPVTLLSHEDLTINHIICPCDFMGAPLIATEQLPSGKEFTTLIPLIEHTIEKKISALVPGEIGGGNAFTALTAASQLGLPIIDGDLIGRAFPQVHMCAPVLAQIPCQPAFLADCKGNQVVVYAKTSEELENMARHIAISMGSHCALISFIMNGLQAQQGIVPGSITKAYTIGSAILQARTQGFSCTQAVLNCCEGVLLAQGIITDINQTIHDGFLEGSVCIETSQEPVELVYQNEYLLARQGPQILATTPDILTLLESDSGTPITSESLKYGLRVDLLALAAPALWQTSAGLALVGPKCFGYNTTYTPINFARL